MKLVSKFLTAVTLITIGTVYSNPSVNCESSDDTSVKCFTEEEIVALVISTFIMTIIFLFFLIGIGFIGGLIFRKMFVPNARNIVLILITSIIINIIYNF